MTTNPVRTRGRVWVIDDDDTALLLSAEILGGAGFEVRTFPEAQSALAAAASGLPDIVVVDVIMPGMDGFEFCSRFRQLPRAALLPILVTTSLDDSASINRAYEAGATDFATKPLHWTIEVHRLQYLLRSADTAQKLLEKECETRLAKEDWELTFHSISDIVTVLDRSFRILRANSAAARMLGTSPEDLVGRDYHTIIHGPKAPPAECPLARALETRQTASAEIKWGPGGAVFEMTASPVTDASGQVIRLVHVARDLTEQKQLEAGLRHAQKMEAIGTLAGGIAHDFNNLLTVILGHADLLGREKARAGQEHSEEEAIIQAAQRGSALAKQLLVFSRKRAADRQRNVLDLNATIQNVRKMLDRVLPKNVTLRFDFAAGLAPISADSGLLEQVLMNLAVNAAHAMPDGGTLAVQTRNIALGPDYCRLHSDAQPGDYVCLVVSDTGHGMDPQTQERIYEPFFTTKKVGEGTGLGLSIVFGIVKEHQAHIACESSLGQGTTFRICFPAVEQPIAPIPSPVPRETGLPRGSETILVVDDEAPIRCLLGRLLTRLGYSVLSAASGDQALGTFSVTSPPPHAVILDLGMPNMSGWECLQKLRHLDPEVRVLIATGYGGEDLEKRSTEQGAAGLLRKPYDAADLALRLRGILDKSARRH